MPRHAKPKRILDLSAAARLAEYNAAKPLTDRQLAEYKAASGGATQRWLTKLRRATNALAEGPEEGCSSTRSSPRLLARLPSLVGHVDVPPNGQSCPAYER